MDFSEALTACKKGNRISRAGWNAPGQWVAFSPGFRLTAERIYSPAIKKHTGGGTSLFGPYVMLRNAQGSFVPWTPSQGDLLAEDWFVPEGE